MDHLQTSQKEKEEKSFELKENEIKVPHERFKRQNKKSETSLPVAVLPTCKKEACAFDYSREITLQLKKTLSLESISLPKNCSNLGKMGHTLSGTYSESN